jgi:hypothetical protein
MTRLATLEAFLEDSGAGPVGTWQGRQTILQHVVGCVQDGTAAPQRPRALLPDHGRYGDKKGEWIPGSQDGVYTYHFKSTSPQAQPLADAVLGSLKEFLQHPSSETLQRFYQKILSGAAIEYVDAFLERVVSGSDLDPRAVQRVGRFLTRKAVDREPVKLGISLLGVIYGDDQQDTAILKTLALHDEFTLFAALALVQRLGRPFSVLHALARQVHGWGRIHLVHLLASADAPAITDWLLLDGYKNTVDLRYTALVCAQTGELAAALAQAAAEDEIVMDAATDLLSALFEPGLTEAIYEYADGVEASTCYLERVATAELTLERLLTVLRIGEFVAEEGGTDGQTDGLRAALGWDASQRKAIAGKVKACIAAASPKPLDLVMTGLHAQKVESRKKTLEVIGLLGPAHCNRSMMESLKAAMEREQHPLLKQTMEDLLAFGA